MRARERDCVPVARCCLTNKSGKASAGPKIAQGYYSSNGVEGMAIDCMVPPPRRPALGSLFRRQIGLEVRGVGRTERAEIFRTGVERGFSVLATPGTARRTPRPVAFSSNRACRIMTSGFAPPTGRGNGRRAARSETTNCPIRPPFHLPLRKSGRPIGWSRGDARSRPP
jgi:hypothetical protein